MSLGRAFSNPTASRTRRPSSASMVVAHRGRRALLMVLPERRLCWSTVVVSFCALPALGFPAPPGRVVGLRAWLLVGRQLGSVAVLERPGACADPHPHMGPGQPAGFAAQPPLSLRAEFFLVLVGVAAVLLAAAHGGQGLAAGLAGSVGHQLASLRTARTGSASWGRWPAPPQQTAPVTGWAGTGWGTRWPKSSSGW